MHQRQQNQTTDQPSPKSKPSTDLIVIEPLQQSTFPVYLAYSKQHNKHVVMKTFPYLEENIHPTFLNELLFCNLSHPNIITILEARSNMKGSCDGKVVKMSYLLLELAPFGDFHNLIAGTSCFTKNEKLVRTYFHQLIEGLEYLHNQGITHMDLSLGNLLLGDEYILKITDFNLSTSANGTRVYTGGRGTKNFRAPEVKEGTCRNPKAADIYSAGIILFSLLTKSLPILEDSQVQEFRIPQYLSEEFKGLFFKMVEKIPENRISLAEIKQNKWYRGEIYSKEELKSFMEKQQIQSYLDN